MKKLLLFSSLGLLLNATSLRADLIWYEGFNYADGPTTNVSGGIWAIHSTSGANDSFVRNNRLEVSGNSSTNAPRQADVNRKFCTSSCTYTSSPTVIYTSFTINCTNLPTAAVTNYIAHVLATATSGFYAKVFSMIGNLPGTWRLGISGTANNPSKIYPVDLAPNTDYQVVVCWDPVTLFAATLWVNPISSADPSVVSNDAVTSPVTSTAYAVRQAAGTTSFFAAITNLAVATTFEEAATNVWTTNAVAPAVVQQPKSTTNFISEAASLSIVASGQGLANLTYQWRKNGGDITNPNGNTNVFTISSAAASDTGDYDVVVTTPFGLSTTSSVAFLWITNSPVPPTITQQPTNTTVYTHQTATLRVVASGTPPLSYQWFRNNTPLSDDAIFAGTTTSTLTITDVAAANNNTGTYRVDVTNPYGPTPSSNAVVSVTNPPVVSIGYLRTLVDPTFFLPTNTTALFTATGIVTSHTNLTTDANSSFYIQDDTGGIDVFFGGNNQARPEAGDSVTVVGPLGQFNSLLELNLTASDPAHSVVTNSHGNPLPPPIVLPFSFTNSAAFGGAGNAIRLYQGSVVMFTNVFFSDGFAGTNVFTGGRNYTITNSAGETFAFRVDARVGDIIGKPIPAFAWTVRGPMSFFLNTTATDRSAGYQLLPTRYADIVTNPPPAMTASISNSASTRTVSWDAVPYDYSYSVLTATNVSGPYAPELTYRAVLLGVNEVPANGSTAIGYGTVALSPDQSRITVNLRFSGLAANANAAHIHGPAGAGTNAAPVFGFTGVPAATSGAIPEQSFAITPTQLAQLQNGLFYMNVHNGTYSGGEIRGQILLVPSVGATFNTSVGTYTDVNTGGAQKFYRVVSP